MEKIRMDLTMFGEEGAAAPAAAAGVGGSATADAGTAGGGAQAPEIPADVSPRIASEMKRQMAAHPEKYQAAGKPQAAAPQAGMAQPVDAQAGQANPEQQAEAELQARWEAAKKGEFAKFYGQDVQNAIRDRFKGQKAAMDELEAYRQMEPALKVLRERAGVETNADLSHQILDDDSLYEDDANEAGMTVQAYKEFLKFKNEHDQHIREREEQQRQEVVRNHYMKLAQQAEELKKQFPGFNLDQELQNPDFLKLTSPSVGISVEDAYFSIHHKELAPQMMAYGMQRAKNQMAQNIMAKGARPREGGLSSQNAAADMQMNFKAMDRKERNKVYEMIHAGKTK